MEIAGAQFNNEEGLWIAQISTDLGSMEVMLDGDDGGPSVGHADAFQRFAQDLKDNLLQVRKQVSMGFLYSPIRIAPNNENRVGVQFKNKITGKQIGMFFWN